MPTDPAPENLLASTEVTTGAGVVVSRSEFHYEEPGRMVGNLTAEYHWDSTTPGGGAIARERRWMTATR